MTFATLSIMLFKIREMVHFTLVMMTALSAPLPIKLHFLVSVMNKGQVLTHYYRIMNKLGGYTWMQTCATVVCSSKNAEEQNIICVNYVIR